MLKKARFLTPPTRAATSPARPESAKTASSPRDTPCPKQGRNFAADPHFTAPRSTARTLLADFFSILLQPFVGGDGGGKGQHQILRLLKIVVVEQLRMRL